MTLRRAMAIVTLAMGLTGELRAQAGGALEPPPPAAQVGMAGFAASNGGRGGGGMAGRLRGPYSLVEKTTTVRVLADGTRITHVSEQKLARDGQGRTRTEVVREVNGVERTEMVNIFDAASRTMIVLSPQEKVASISHFPEAPLAGPPPMQSAASERPTNARAGAPNGPAASAPTGTAASAPAATGSNGPQRVRLTGPDNAGQPTSPPPLAGRAPGVTVERLGQRTIAGVIAQGRRTTRVIPVGQQGNDRELKVVTEVWRSPELEFDLERTVDDPINGKTETMVTELDRGEPDPRLFQVPEGYRVVEQ